VEKVTERHHEPEPKELIYDWNFRWRLEKKRRTVEGKVIIRGKDMQWEQNRQAYLKYMVHAQNWPEIGAPGWFIFINRIKKHSGMHRHQGGLGLYVLEGKGYTVVDGVRYDWEKDDLILLPVKPNGCEHQHFNADPTGQPAEWLAFIYDPFRDAMGNEIEQKSTADDWKGGLTPDSKIHA